MSLFLKRVSSLGQNFFACLPAGRPLQCLKSQWGSIKEGRGRKPRGPCIFWEKCQGGCVDIDTIFKNPDTYWGRIFWQALQFNCSSPKPVMGKTLAFPWHSQPIYVWIFQHGVEFGVKLFHLPAANSRHGGLCGAWKARGWLLQGG